MSEPYDFTTYVSVGCFTIGAVCLLHFIIAGVVNQLKWWLAVKRLGNAMEVKVKMKEALEVWMESAKELAKLALALGIVVVVVSALAYIVGWLTLTVFAHYGL